MASGRLFPLPGPKSKDKALRRAFEGQTPASFMQKLESGTFMHCVSGGDVYPAEGRDLGEADNKV